MTYKFFPVAVQHVDKRYFDHSIRPRSLKHGRPCGRYEYLRRKRRIVYTHVKLKKLVLRLA